LRERVLLGTLGLELRSINAADADRGHFLIRPDTNRDTDGIAIDHADHAPLVNIAPAEEGEKKKNNHRATISRDAPVVMEGDTRGRRVLFYKRGEYLEEKPGNQESHAYR
jgi:hypothetical protein